MVGSPPSSLDALSAEAFASLGSMEGVYEPIVEVTTAAPEQAGPLRGVRPGYVAAAVVAALAYGLHYLPMPPFRVVSESVARHPISAAIIAILLGLGVRNLLPVPASVADGCKGLVKRVIPYAIVLTGAGLNLRHLASVGLPALGITVLCMILAIAVAYYFGRMLGLGDKLAMLIGAGTGVCGNSAIVAVAPLIDAEDEDLVLSIGTVNLFGLLVMLACPLIGAVLVLSQDAFGVWAGTTIHALPQVVAAGFAHGPDAGALATLVKLVRVALLAPLVFALAVLYARHHSEPKRQGREVIVHYARFVPWFVWAFTAMALLGTLGVIPELRFASGGILGGPGEQVTVSLVGLFTQAGKLLLTLAMAAIGLEVDVRLLARVSGRAVVTGLVSSIALCAGSLGLIYLLM
ncbi:MAG: putative sulfate exporter family transporter [bacterium]|nr:putative sulfate exporter family transporter [bacterium]